MMFILHVSILLLSLYTCVNATCYTETTHEVDCEHRWSEWSECDPCTKRRSRHVKVTRKPSDAGVGCPNITTMSELCTSTGLICESLIRSCDEDNLFDCGTGQCLNNDLVCNGEDDCLNNHDEYNCSSVWRSPKCKNEPVPYLNSIGLGYDVLNDKPLARVIDVQRFNGFCNSIQYTAKDTYYRLPASVADYQFQVKTSGVATTATFNSTKDFSSHLEDNSRTSVSASASSEFWFVHTAASMSYQHSSEYQSLVGSTKNRQVNIVIAGTSVEIAQFMLNQGSDVSIDPHFHRAVMTLPSIPDAIAYTNFFDQFGVAYAHAGTLGGVYRTFYSFDKETIKKSGLTAEETSKCLKKKMSVELWSSFKASSDKSDCSNGTGGKKSAADVENNALVKVILVRGGDEASAAALASTSTSDSSSMKGGDTRYNVWLESLKSNPYLLSKEYRSVCELIRYTRRNDADQLAKSCTQIAQIYLNSGMAHSCDCQNDGKPVVMTRNRCSCACADGFHGVKCEGVGSGSDLAMHPFKLDEHHNEYIQSEQIDCNPASYSTLIAENDKGIYAVCYVATSDSYSFQYIPIDTLKSSVLFNISTDFSDSIGIIGRLIDFDISHDGSFYLTMHDSSALPYLVKLNRSGNVEGFVKHPCSSASPYHHQFVATMCNGLVVVTCNKMSVIKFFSADLVPFDIIPIQTGSATFIAYSLSVSGNQILVSDTKNLFTINTQTWQQSMYEFSSTTVNAHMRPDGILIGSYNSNPLKIYYSDHSLAATVNLETEAVISVGKYLYGIVENGGSYFIRKYPFLYF